MLSIRVFFLSVALDLCIALPSDALLVRQDVNCQNATAHKPTCWADLGYDDWFDTWQGPCPGPPGCSCDVRKPWSDCLLKQYQTSAGHPAGPTISCTDLTRPDLCSIPPSDWTELSENELAVAYVATAIENLYRFVHGWYVAVTQTPAPDAVLETLFNQITGPSNTSVNRTDVHIATYLADLMTKYSTNSTLLQRFKGAMTEVVGEDTAVDIGTINIRAFQEFLGLSLGKTLNATIATWNNPYFDCLSNDGLLLYIAQVEMSPQLNNSLVSSPPSQSFDITGHLGNLVSNSTSRELLSRDYIKHRDYTIAECDGGEPGGLAEQVSDLLDTMHNNLFTVMRETSKGRRSEYGFSNLWQSNEWLPIQNIYKKMYNAEPAGGALPEYKYISDDRPVFICLQPHNPDTYAAYQVCKNEIRLRAFQQPGNPNLIGLCPAFWALPANPPRAFCPYKGKVTASFIGTALQLNQQAVLIHQLVKIYLDRQIIDPQAFSLVDTLGLTPDEAYRNPSTWAYWYSSVVGCSALSWGNPEL